jgi:hypothetical protein
MLKKTAAILTIVLLVFVLGCFLGNFANRWLSLASPQILNTAAILKQVQTLSQLVTVKYVLEKVVVLDDAKWYGESRVILVAHGVVKAGIDLEGLQAADVKISDRKIILTLPRPRMTDVYLDDHRTEILERTTGIMRIFDKDLEQNARRQAVDDIRRAALDNGILKDADERAHSQLSNLLYQLGFQQVELHSK